MNCLVVEMGSRNLKIANVAYNKNNLHIIKANSFEITPSLITENRIADKDGFVAFLKDCLTTGGFKKQNTILLLDDSFTFMKEFTHPKTKIKHLRGLAVFEAENILSLREKDYAIETYPYGDRYNNDNQYKSILYAIKKEFVYDITGAFKQAGLNVVKIVPFIYSYTNVMRRLLNERVTPQYKGKTIAAIDFGAVNTKLVVFSGKIPVFQKIQNSVSQNINTYISRYLNISPEEAEEYKRRNGFANTEENRKNHELYNSIIRVTDSMIEEILRSIRIILSSERLELDGLILTGGFSLTPDFAEHITEVTGLPCRRIDELSLNLGSFIKLDYSVTDIFRSFSNLIGISGACFDTENTSVNLFRKSKKKRDSTKSPGSAFLTFLLIFMAFVLCAAPFVYRYQERQLNEQYRQSLDRPEYQKALKLKNELLDANDELYKRSYENTTIKEDTKASALLDTLADSQNNNIRIGYVSYDESNRILTADIFAKDLSVLESFREKLTGAGLKILNNADIKKATNSETYVTRLELQYDSNNQAK